MSRGNATVESQRRQTADKIGFDAYGVTVDMPDPMVEAVNKLLDHIHETDKRFEEMRCSLRKLGEHIDTLNPLELDDWMAECRQQQSNSDFMSYNEEEHKAQRDALNT